MYLRKILNKKSERIYLSIVKGYKDPETKNIKQKLVKCIGHVDELEKDFEDPITHFKGVARQMTEETKETARPLNFNLFANETIDTSSILRKNLSFSVLSFFYHQLKVNKFFINRQRNLDIKYALNSVFQMLVYSRVLCPCSKKQSFEKWMVSF